MNFHTVLKFGFFSGTLDAMMPDDSIEVVDQVNRLFAEIERLLKLGGRYICISLLQPHILNHIVTWFADRGWPLRILRCTDVELAKAPEDRIFPVFAIVATKFRKMNNATPILEISLSRCVQCGILRKFLSLRFYVKSILEDVKVQKMPFLQFRGSEFLVWINFGVHKMQKFIKG